MSYELHRAAEQDILEAARFYKREGGVMLARRFLAEFERVAALLVEQPGFGTPADAERRIYPLRGFPYSVIYREWGGRIRVLVVRSQHRDPGFGDTRR